MPESHPSFLIVSFDGLRPDLLCPELTPHLCRLQNMGVTLSEHRTVYPSETRSSFPSLVTGATTDKHGMVGNKYVDRKTRPPRYIDTSDTGLLRRLDRESGGRLMSAPTLGELLARSGRSLAVLATNTSGTTRLFHHKAEDVNHIRLSGHYRQACTPETVLETVETRLGPMPPETPPDEPNYAAQDWITSAFLEFIRPDFRPDVTVLSYGEPDVCSHYHGTCAPKTRSMIAHCDGQFGRVLDWWETEGRQAGVQIIAISDHGHITGHTRVCVMDDLQTAGFSPAQEPGPDIDVVVVPGQVGALYLTDPTVNRIEKLVEAVTGQPWCGPVFTAPKNGTKGIISGTLGRHLVFADHHRAPDVYFAFRADDRVDSYGLVGGTYHEHDRGAGLGVHGGLHPMELAALGIVAGSCFPTPGFVSKVPTGICDFAPTILSLLGLTIPKSMTGRVLDEVTGTASLSDLNIRIETYVARRGNYRQVLQRIRAGTTCYIKSGTAEGP